MKRLNKNDRTIIINIIKVFGVKGGAVFINLLTVPVYIAYFSDANILGVWYTIISILSWILTFDLGIGNGLRNKLTLHLTLKDYEGVKEYITSAYVVITFMMTIGGIFFVSMLRFVDWNLFFNISSDVMKNDVLYKVVCVVVCSLLIQFTLNITKSILYAIQEAAVPSFLALCTSIINLLYAKFAPISSPEENLIRFAVVYLFAANMPLLLCTIWVFKKRLKGCAPRLKYLSFTKTKDILGLGGAFFFVQVLYMLIMNTNEFLISRIQGPDKVVDYQIYYKIFSSIGMGVSLALTPIWSAVTEAVAKRDYTWIKSITYKLVIVGSIITMGILSVIPLFKYILPLWLGNQEFRINYFYLAMFAILGIVLVFNGILSNVANGLSALKTQLVCFSTGAVIHIVGGIMITIFLDSWIGMVIATIIAIVPYLIAQPIALFKIFQDLKSEMIKK